MEQNLHSASSSSSSSSSSEDNEDYINMEVDHHSSFGSSIFSHSATSKEFEFQSFSSSSDRDHTTTSPADELFYMGKLLPLHKILQNTASFDIQKVDDERFSTPLFTPSFNNTPFESCNVSPSESCHVSRELDPTLFLAEYYSGNHKEKKSWPKKPSKMKWTSYLKSLFGKTSGCSNEHSAAAANGGSARNTAPFGQIKENGGHRRSFSGAFKRLQAKPKTTSCSKANNCKRSSVVSGSSEIDSPIQAAIAHCKRSQINADR